MIKTSVAVIHFYHSILKLIHTSGFSQGVAGSEQLRRARAP